MRKIKVLPLLLAGVCLFLLINGCGTPVRVSVVSNAPKNLTASASTTQSRTIIVSWEAGTFDATGYNLYYSTEASVSVSTGTKITGTSAATYTVSDLLGGATYYFIVTGRRTTVQGASLSASAVTEESEASPVVSAVAPLLWETEAIDSSDANTGQYSSLALNSSNEAHVAYFSVTSGRLKYTSNALPGGTWETPSFVGDATAISGPLATSIKYSGGSGTAYSTGGNAALNIDYASKGSSQGLIRSYMSSMSGWYDRLVSTALSNNAAGVSVVEDGNYYLHVSANINGAIYYLTNSPTGEWNAALVDSSAGAGSTTSIVVGADNKPIVVYYHAVNGDLISADPIPGTWRLTTLESQGNIGKSPSISFYNNQLFIAYHDVTNSKLKYLRQAGAEIDTETVDTGVTNVTDTAITGSSGTVPHIAYIDGASNGVKYASRAGGFWHDVNVFSAAGSVSGSDVSLAVGSDGRPRLTYYADQKLYFSQEKQ